MTTVKKIAMLEEIMDLNEGELKLDSVLNELEEWDSLSKLSLIVMAKQDFGLILTTDDIKSFDTVKDICNYLK